MIRVLPFNEAVIVKDVTPWFIPITSVLLEPDETAKIFPLGVKNRDELDAETVNFEVQD